jgi:hypothetical protein
MEEIFVTVGLACLIAAIVGGGLKAFGIEIRVLESTTRQIALGSLGLILIVVGMILRNELVIGPPNPEPETVFVPNVVGLPIEKAKTTLEKSDLKPGRLESQQTDTASPGTVLKQEPPAGVRVSKSETVDFVVAEAPRDGWENWLSGNYDAALDDFAAMVKQSADAAARELAKRRLDWLGRYRGRIIFADDLQNDTIRSGARWELHEPGPGTGTGQFARMQENGNGNYVLEGRGHYHAVAQIQNGGVTRDFEIQLRFRPTSARAGGAHINTMMDAAQGRTTIGIYVTEKRISVWESLHGQRPDPEISKDRTQSFNSRWYKLRAVIGDARVQVFLDDKLVIDYASPRPELFLQRFNLESLEGVMQFDDVLVVSR